MANAESGVKGVISRSGCRIVACFYVFAALLNLIANGWRSISWMPWLLMAFGLSAVSQVVDGRKSERSKWHSPTYVVGFAACLLGAAFLLPVLSIYLSIYLSTIQSSPLPARTTTEGCGARRARRS